jgi:hypothetical protein
MGKEREIEILEYKINNLTNKITEFINHGISDRKIENLRTLKLKYETELAALKA